MTVIDVDAQGVPKITLEDILEDPKIPNLENVVEGTVIGNGERGLVLRGIWNELRVFGV